jgi:hypothetical protein
MPTLSFAEWFFLALGTAGFARFGWCLVYLIGDEEPMPAWLDKALDALVGAGLAASERARQMAVDALRLIAVHLEPQKGATR